MRTTQLRAVLTPHTPDGIRGLRAFPSGGQRRSPVRCLLACSLLFRAVQLNLLGGGGVEGEKKEERMKKKKSCDLHLNLLGNRLRVRKIIEECHYDATVVFLESNCLPPTNSLVRLNDVVHVYHPPQNKCRPMSRLKQKGTFGPKSWCIPGSTESR